VTVADRYMTARHRNGTGRSPDRETLDRHIQTRNRTHQPKPFGTRTLRGRSSRRPAITAENNGQISAPAPRNHQTG
jgi:hypothetical protein